MKTLTMDDGQAKDQSTKGGDMETLTTFEKELIEEIKERLEKNEVVALMDYRANSFCDLCDKERNKVFLLSFPDYSQKELDEDEAKHGTQEGYYENVRASFGTSCITKFRKKMKEAGIDLKKLKKL